MTAGLPGDYETIEVLQSNNRELSGDRDRRRWIEKLRLDREDSGEGQAGRAVCSDCLVDTWSIQYRTRYSIRTERGIGAGKNPASVDVRAATDRRIARRAVGVYARREIRGTRPLVTGVGGGVGPLTKRFCPCRAGLKCILN